MIVDPGPPGCEGVDLIGHHQDGMTPAPWVASVHEKAPRDRGRAVQANSLYTAPSTLRQAHRFTFSQGCWSAHSVMACMHSIGSRASFGARSSRQTWGWAERQTVRTMVSIRSLSHVRGLGAAPIVLPILRPGPCVAVFLRARQITGVVQSHPDRAPFAAMFSRFELALAYFHCVAKDRRAPE